MKNQQTPKPKKVPVSRVKQVSDSLKHQEAKKATGGYGLVMNKKSTPAQVKLGYESIRSAGNDKARYSRLDSLVKKATAPKAVKKAPPKKK